MNDEVLKISTPYRMVTFTDSRKISSSLIKAKLYPLERDVVGSCRCGKKRREVCVNTSGMDAFTTTVTVETCQMNHLFNCDDKCLIYL